MSNIVENLKTDLITNDHYIDLECLRDINQIEKAAIIYTMIKTKGDVLETSRILGIGSATCYRKLKKYGITARIFNDRRSISDQREYPQ